MNSEGWLFESSGLAKILELNSVLRQKTVDEFNKASCLAENTYSPWMCQFGEHKTLGSVVGRRDFFVTEEESLGILSEAYKISEAKQVYVNGEQTASISIATPLQEQYKNDFKKAFDLIEDNGTILSQLFDKTIDHVVPLRTVPSAVQKIGVGFSSQYARGAIFLGLPNLGDVSHVQLAINLVHEIGHQVLMIYQSADQIIAKGLHSEVYSFVRKCNRPAIQAFHASVALAYMVHFLKNTDHRKLPAKESAFANSSLNTLEADFKNSVLSFKDVEFSDVGQLLYGDLCNYAS